MCLLASTTDLHGRRTVWNVSSSVPGIWLDTPSIYGYGTNYSFYVGIYIQQSNFYVLPTEGSPWYMRSGNFIVASPTSSSSTSSSASSSGSNTLQPSTTLSSSSATLSSGGPSATSSAGAGTRTAMDQLGWGALGLICVLAIW